MKSEELFQIIIAILVLTIVIGFSQFIKLNFSYIGEAILFAFIVIALNLLVKKVTARALDADVVHSTFSWGRYGFKPNRHLNKEIPAGIVFPLVLSAFSLGVLKCMSLLTYETTPLKRRAARRFGIYSYTEMTDLHNGIVGAAGITAVLILSFIGYWFAPLERLSEIAAYYAFWNMIPFSKLDGSQIYFGSRVMWTCLAVITLIFTAYALILF